MRLTPSRFLNLLVVFLIPLINLGFTSIYIPNSMKVIEYADWRFASSLIAFTGILHLGIADGVYVYWLGKSDAKPSINSHFMILLMLVIIFNSSILTLIIFLYDFLSSAGIIALFFVFLSASMFSLSNYFALVFLEKNQFRIAIASQSVVFFLCVVIADFIGIFTAPIIIASYALSCIPLNFIMIRNITFTNRQSAALGEILTMLKSGFAILLANLLLILFINIDKLYARFYLENDIVYAKYSVASSVFVAACGLGLSVGAYLVSKKSYFFNFKYRLLVIIGVSIGSVIIAPIISQILNLLIRSYEIDYTYFVILSILAFFVFATYVSYCKFLLPKLCQKIFLLFPVVYISIVSIGVLLLGASFNNLSITVLLAFLAFVILVVEVKGDFKRE